MYKTLQISERKVTEVSFDHNWVRLKEDYIDVFEGVKTHIMNTATYDENCDRGTNISRNIQEWKTG